MCVCAPGAVSGFALWDESLSMLTFGVGVSVAGHKAEQLWDKAVFPASGERVGQDHR